MADTLQGLSIESDYRDCCESVTEEVAEEIASEAHALAGSLGSFGFVEATPQCREIERVFRDCGTPTSQQLQDLREAIAKVRESINDEQTSSSPNGSALSCLLHSQPPQQSAAPRSQLPAHVLLIQPATPGVHTWLETLAKLLKDTGGRLQQIETAEQAAAAIAQQQPDIVLMDAETLPSASLHCEGSSGTDSQVTYSQITELKRLAPAAPLLLLTRTIDFEDRVRFARLGISGLLQMPMAPVALLEAVSKFWSRGAAPGAKLLIVDDDSAVLMLLESLLQDWGFQFQLLSDPQQFWKTLESYEPDLVLLDIEMPQLSGFDLCKVMRNEPRWSELPVLFLSAHTEAETIQQVFAVGADDYIRKPIVAPELVARVLSWLERARMRRQQAEIDSLTGVDNRRKSTQTLNRLLGLAHRYEQSLCFAVVDFDDFKRINDSFGHATGDRLLRRFGACLRSSFREEDVVARWGGEEFVIGLYGSGREEGTYRLNQFLEDWKNMCNSQPDNKLKVTFSAGFAMYPEDADSLQDLYQVADEALYRAKAAGRNRVLSYA